LELDETANDRGGPSTSQSDSRVAFSVIPTNEELMIAQHTRRLHAAEATWKLPVLLLP
jgi:acetate kinase